MDEEKYIETIAKGLYGLAFRNGPLEGYHAEGCPIGDKEMEVLNRYGYNVLCYMVKLIVRGETEKFVSLCAGDAILLSYFDPPDYDSAEIKQLERTYEIYKELED